MKRTPANQRRNTEKHVSYFTKIYIVIIMAYIIFLFYYIYAEFVKINLSNIYLIEKQNELVFLDEKLEKLQKIKNRMNTAQYQDRINKEIKGKLAAGEHQFKTPQIAKKTEQEIQAEEAKIYLQKPVIEEWKDVFFLN